MRTPIEAGVHIARLRADDLTILLMFYPVGRPFFRRDSGHGRNPGGKTVFSQIVTDRVGGRTKKEGKHGI
jgi:hypothetical protein